MRLLARRLATTAMSPFPGRALIAACLSLCAASAGAFDTTAREAFLVDFETGAVLIERDADKAVPPASMSKLMTVYMMFQRLRDGALALDDTLPVSEKAWRTGGSKMFVEVDTDVSVEDLLRGIVVQSGNDACVVVAEGLSGSEAAFAEEMNREAREIGLLDSHFTNASGLPDPAHVMSPRDLARLTRLLIVEFPEFFPYFAETSFSYGGIDQNNRNPLLYADLGADGMKTGYTRAAGYSLTATASRDGRRLILVLTGLESGRARSQEAARVLSWAFRETRNHTLFEAGEEVAAADVWLGAEKTVPLVAGRDVKVTLPRAFSGGLGATLVLESPVPAPVAAGAPIAALRLEGPGIDAFEAPLLAGADVGEAGPFGRAAAMLNWLVFGPPSP